MTIDDVTHDRATVYVRVDTDEVDDVILLLYHQEGAIPFGYRVGYLYIYIYIYLKALSLIIVLINNLKSFNGLKWLIFWLWKKQIKKTST